MLLHATAWCNFSCREWLMSETKIRKQNWMAASLIEADKYKISTGRDQYYS